MKNKTPLEKAIISALAACAVFAGLFSFSIIAEADEQEVLQSQIDQKTKELEEIQARKREVERALEATSGSKKKLSDELAKINGTINQLNLSIRENRTMIEKLNLEISSLGHDITSTEDSIRLKKATMGKLFAEIQQNDGQSLLSILLKSENLSDGLAAAQSIESVSVELRNNLLELNALKGTLSEQLEREKGKKETREIEQENLKNRQYIVEDEKKGKQTLLTETKNQEKSYQAQLTALEKLQAEVDAEIERIASELRKRIDNSLLPGRGVLENPLPGAKLTQAYGFTAFAKRAYSSQRHNGIDFGAQVGTPIYAAEAGRVLAAIDQDGYCRKGAYGKYVLIKHGNGLTTLSAHMSRFSVSAGQTVRRGEIIGYVGSTGYATGPHLHFTVFASNTIPPASSGFPEGTQASRVCGPMPVGGDLDPRQYLAL